MVAAAIAATAITLHAEDDVWDKEYIRNMYAGRKLTPIEGVWQFPGDGAIIAITASSATTCDIIVLDSPKLNVAPGTHIGTAVLTAKNGTYDGTLKSREFGKKGKLGSENVTFNIAEGGRLIVRPYSTGLSLSFRRWFYRIFGLSIVNNNTRPKDIDGALRIYPYIESDHYPIVL